MRKDRWLAIFAVEGILVFVTGAVTFLAPFRSEFIEAVVTAMALMCTIVVGPFTIVAFYAGSIHRRARVSDNWWLIPILFALVCILVLLPYITREFYASLVQPGFRGTVVGRYRSDNHQYPVIEVRSESGEILALEGMQEDVWRNITVGDPIEKEPWSAWVQVHGKPIRLIPRSWRDRVWGSK